MTLAETPAPCAARTRVLVADDHPVVRAGVVAILGASPDYEVVAQAADGQEALDGILALRPDFAVLDVRMPRLSGLDVVERARAAGVDTAFVLLTMLAEGAELERAMDLEVDGYVVKGSAAEDIRHALDAVRRGSRVIPASDARRAMGFVPSAMGEAEARRVLALVTPTERVVLRHLAENKTSRQIAAELRVSVRTVQNHRANVCDKLGLRGANKLLQFALENRAHLTSLPGGDSS